MDKAGARVKAACPLLSIMIIARRMKDRPAQPAPRPTDDRAARLAEALRANLHRRKAQARAVGEAMDAADKADQ